MPGTASRSQASYCPAYARRNNIHKRIWLYCIVAFSLSVGVRLLEFPRWNRADLQVAGERLLATNDAYFWVAGTEGVNPVAQSHPMAKLLGAMSWLFPGPLANIAFWASIVLAALVAIPLVLWCDFLRIPKATFAAPLLVTLTPAFFNRTRLGFYDSDWATLFFPLLIGWLLGVWVQTHLGKSGPSNHDDPDTSVDRILPVCLILLTAIAVPWHNSISVYLLATLGIAFILLLFLGSSEARSATFPGLIAVGLVVWMGWIGAVAGLLILWLASQFSAQFHDRRATRLMGILFAALLIWIMGFHFREYLSAVIPAYAGKLLGQAESQNEAFTLIFPDTTASIQETSLPDLGQALTGSSFHALLGAAGIGGYFILLRRKAAAWFLLPLLVLGLGSVHLGVRFTMYAAPAIMLGLFAALDWALSHTDQRGAWGTLVKIGIAVIMLLALFPPLYQLMQYLPVETVVDKAHAEALSELGQIGDPAGTIWTSWDYGYASQHFAGMNTFADGRRNSGEYLFSLGVTLGSESLDRSADLIRFAAQNQNAPWETWATWRESEWEPWLEGLGRDNPPSEPLPVSVYLIVQWEAIPSLSWAQYYGSWDFTTQQGQRSRVWSVTMPQELDLNTGEFHFNDDQLVYSVTIDILSEAGVQHYDYPATGGPHLLLNDVTREVMLLDENAYRSAFIQLLLMPVKHLEATSSFRLIIENMPFVRVFELQSVGDASLE